MLLLVLGVVARGLEGADILSIAEGRRGVVEMAGVGRGVGVIGQAGALVHGMRLLVRRWSTGVTLPLGKLLQESTILLVLLAASPSTLSRLVL